MPGKPIRQQPQVKLFLTHQVRDERLAAMLKFIITSRSLSPHVGDEPLKSLPGAEHVVVTLRVLSGETDCLHPQEKRLGALGC